MNYTSNALMTITDSTFNNNAVTTDGGAIYNSETLTIGTNGGYDSTLFRNNYAGNIGNGGAIWNNSVLSLFNGVVFAGNYTDGDGGAIYNNGTATIIGIHLSGMVIVIMIMIWIRHQRWSCRGRCNFKRYR